MANKTKPQKSAVRFSVPPTREFQGKHDVVETESSNGMSNYRLKDATVLERLWRTNSLNTDQLYAGQRYYCDWYYSAYNRVPRTLWDEMRKPQGAYIEGIMDCTKRYDLAVKELVHGSVIHIILQNVVVYDNTIEKASTAAHYGRKAGAKKLKHGLDTLISLYEKII